MQVSYMKMHDEYNDCIIEIKDANCEIISEKYKHVALCKVHQNNRETRRIVFAGNTREEVLNAMFIKRESWRYCNDMKLVLDKRYEDYFNDYFYGENGLENYAKAGGNMI